MKRGVLIAWILLCAFACSAFRQSSGVPMMGSTWKGTGGGGGGTWTQVQNKICTSDGLGACGVCVVATTTCIVTATSVAASDKLVIWASYITGGLLTVTYNGETWTNPSPTCAQWDATTGSGIACSYVLSATGGETSFTCTFSSAPGTFSSCGFIQWHYTGPSASFDTSGLKADTACTSCAGVTLTLSGSNDAIAQFGIPTSGSFTAITSPYSTNATMVDGMLAASSLNTASGTAPTLTQSISGTAFIGAVALKGN